MEAVISLKRSTPVSFEMCIICQDSKHDKLFVATSQGISSLRDATAAREKLRDYKYRDTIDRLKSVLKSDPSEMVPVKG